MKSRKSEHKWKRHHWCENWISEIEYHSTADILLKVWGEKEVTHQNGSWFSSHNENHNNFSTKISTLNICNISNYDLIFFRTLLNSPLLRRKRGGFDNKSSLDSSEEELNTCPASNSPSPTPRHRLLQVTFSFFNSAQFWGLWFRIEYSIVIIVPFISGETGQTQTGWLSEPRDFPEAKTQTESNSKFYFA